MPHASLCVQIWRFFPTDLWMEDFRFFLCTDQRGRCDSKGLSRQGLSAARADLTPFLSADVIQRSAPPSPLRHLLSGLRPIYIRATQNGMASFAVGKKTALFHGNFFMIIFLLDISPCSLLHGNSLVFNPIFFLLKFLPCFSFIELIFYFFSILLWYWCYNILDSFF